MIFQTVRRKYKYVKYNCLILSQSGWIDFSSSFQLSWQLKRFINIIIFLVRNMKYGTLHNICFLLDFQLTTFPCRNVGNNNTRGLDFSLIVPFSIYTFNFLQFVCGSTFLLFISRYFVVVLFCSVPVSLKYHKILAILFPSLTS